MVNCVNNECSIISVFKIKSVGCSSAHCFNILIGLYSVLLQYLCQTKTLADIFCLIFTQFEIIGDACNGSDHEWDLFKPMINGKYIYIRLLIKKLSLSKF